MPHSAGDDFAERSGLDFASCGSQRLVADPSCCAVTTGGYECLLAALASCSPARLDEMHGTVEGDAILQDYFVVPLAVGCEVVVVRDERDDAFRNTNYPAVTETHCSVARLRAAAEATACPRIVVDACHP